MRASPRCGAKTRSGDACRSPALRGRSRTDFVRDAAVRTAEDVLMETEPIRMSAAGFKALMAALSEPGTAVSEMVEPFRRAAPWEANGSKNASKTGS
jgi:uncharacterized protein (DUF1778 family)